MDSKKEGRRRPESVIWFADVQKFREVKNLEISTILMELLKNRCDVINGRSSGDGVRSRVLDLQEKTKIKLLQ